MTRLNGPTGKDVQDWSAYFPFREFFALDIRSLALFRVCLAIMILLDTLDRIPDLRTFYSDEGVLPRLLTSGLHPVSIHILSGEVWFQGLLIGMAILFALMLLVGWKTPLATFLCFFLLISIHGRNPGVMHGADHLIRAITFWSIFLPLGACWSVDSCGPGNAPRGHTVLSLGSFAFIGQVCIVYLFAAAWKWNPEWRDKNTAVLLALQVDSFSTRLGKLLLEYPRICEWLTIGSVWLETLGPALLLLPFNVGLQRLIVIFLFVGFHAGLALTLELSLFPWIAASMWLALLPGSFWDRQERHWKTTEMDATRIVYDPVYPRASWTAFAWQSFLLFGAGKVEAVSGTMQARIGTQGGWAVIGPDGIEVTGARAVIRLCALSPIFSPLAWVLEKMPALAGGMAALAGGRRQGEPAEAAKEPAWRPPSGAVPATVLLMSFTYVLLFNLRTIGSEYLHPNPTGFARPDEEKTPLNRFFEQTIPVQFMQFGAVTGLEQGWGVFAPRPARVIGYSYALATLANGKQVELMRGRERYQKGLPPDLDEPENYQLSFPNGRWRKWMLNLPAKDLYPYAWIGHMNWLVKDWNAKHSGGEEMVRMVLVFRPKENRNPGEGQAPLGLEVLGTFPAVQASDEMLKMEADIERLRRELQAKYKKKYEERLNKP